MVKELAKVCDGFPSAWEGITDSGVPFCVRYRWGKLGLYLGARGTQVADVEVDHPAVEQDDGSGGGLIEWSEVERRLGSWLKS